MITCKYVMVACKKFLDLFNLWFHVKILMWDVKKNLLIHIFYGCIKYRFGCV